MQDFNYDHIAPYYDQLELDSELNQKLVSGLCKFFENHTIKSVWDASCGTGAQCIPLADAGYKVHASDISASMLKHAAAKTKDINFNQGDICSHRVSKVDAVISLYNALGHLNRERLQQALYNVHSQLNTNGFFIGDFDNRMFLETPGILSKDYFLSGQGVLDNKKFQRLTRALPLNNGRYKISDRWLVDKQLFHEADWELQTWTLKELAKMAKACGFKIFSIKNRAFENFENNFERESDSFLIIFQKV